VAQVFECLGSRIQFFPGNHLLVELAGLFIESHYHASCDIGGWFGSFY
jgi:hypothetical protein